MNLRTLFYFYGWRLRAHPLQEVLAGAGIAIGVALLFAVQVANTSITGSVEQLIHAITGRAQLEMTSRDEQGFDQRLLPVVRGVPGVAVAAPSLERRAVVRGPHGQEAIELIGVDLSLAGLGGTATRQFGPGRLKIPRDGILIPDRLSQVTGVNPGEYLTLAIGGHARRVRVASTLNHAQIGSLTGSSVAIAPLGFTQRLAGMQGHISRILIRAKPEDMSVVRKALTALAGTRLDVGPADSTVRRLQSATAPDDQSTALFSAISAMIGVLFAFNAMLLTMPDRRAFVAELRTQGFTPLQVVVVLTFQALVLGVAASVAGLLLGDLLSRTVFHQVPTYLAFTFPIGTQRVVPFGTIALAFGAGIVASLLAASRPLADVFSRLPLDAVYDERGDLGEGINAGLRLGMLLTAVAILVLVTLLVVVVPRATIVGVVVLAIALLLVIPATFATGVPIVEGVARRLRRNMLLVAVMGARSAMTRSIAVAAIAALAAFGSIAIGGARNDLVQGLEAGFRDHVSTADIWITTVGRSLTTDPFHLSARELARLHGAPEFDSVRVYQGGMLDIRDRRVWVIARPRNDPRMVPPTQIVQGDLGLAERRLREHGWAAVSRTIADDRGLRVGEPFAFPTPTGPMRLRLAATVTNLGWGSGAVIINTGDYRRYWRTTDPSAIEIDLAPHVTAAAGIQAVKRALNPGHALDIQTAKQLDGEFTSLLQEGLTRLGQISVLLVIAAALALAAAMSAAIWQRRQRLATHKVQGFKEAQLRRILLFEAILVLAVGCALGTLAGVFAHLLGNRWLELTTGFPASFSLQVMQALTTLGLIMCGAAAIVAIAGFLAARVSPAASFRE